MTSSRFPRAAWAATFFASLAATTGPVHSIPLPEAATPVAPSDQAGPLIDEALAAVRRGDFSVASQFAQRALRVEESNFGLAPMSLTSLNDLAREYQSRGRLAEAVTLLRVTMESVERSLGRDHPDTLRAVADLAYYYQTQGRYAESESLSRRALEGQERTLGRDHPDTLRSLGNLAFLYRQQGRYSEAEPLFVRALETYERTVGRDHADTIRTVNNLAALYESQRRLEEAEPLYRRAMEDGERVLGKDHLATVHATNNLAVLWLRRGRTAEAEPLVRQVAESMGRIAGAEHPDTLAAINNLAMLQQGLGQLDQAASLFFRVIQAQERSIGADHPLTLITVRNLAVLRALQTRDDEADALFLRVMEARERTLGPNHPATIEAAGYLSVFRLETGNSDSALGPARLAVVGVRSRRFSAAEDRFSSAQGSREQRNSAQFFRNLADAAWNASAADQAQRPRLAAESFTALQDAAAGSTDRALIRMSVRRAAGEAGSRLSEIVREREALDERWSANSLGYSASLATSGAEADRMRAELRAERIQIEARMDALDATLRSDFPQYFSLVRPDPLDVAAARALLAPDEAILLIVPTTFGTHVIALSRTGMEWTRSEWTRVEINAAVRRLLWDVGANVNVGTELSSRWQSEGGAGYPFARRTAFDLYRQIVAPVASVLQGKRHVFVAAAGSLTSLPFGILVTDEPQGADGDPSALRSTRWFADAHALVQIPTIQSLQFLRRFGRNRSPGTADTGGFVGFGDPLLQGAATARGRNRGRGGTGLAAALLQQRTRSGGTVANIRQLSQLSRLPGTVTELESMRVALNAPSEALYLADRATETRLRTMNLSGTRVLALATHGLVAGEIPSVTEPGLVFTPPTQASDADDGFLTASEVSALRLDADWVILSACNTAANDGSEGAPGLSGLARAFFYAGARNLLVSHWPVRDDVAARLTVRTIQLLNEQPGLSRGEALQHAMREIRDDPSHDTTDDSWAHPNAWAPFTLVGDGAH